ncbi:MAG: extracellular solute-binding protein [Treponema sp.]|nr:extracellular solute-binding protein [Treponema sp.]
MNILNFYRKFVEKSRSFGFKKINIRRLDIFLFCSALALAVFVLVNLFLKTAADPRRATLFIAPQFETVFGRDPLETLIREFESQNPELHITTADSSPADILFFDDGQFSGMVREGALLSLAPYLHTETETGQWAVSLVSFMDLFCYNIDILKAAHFDRPPKTHLEVLTYARAVTSRDAGIYGMAFGLGPGDRQALRRELYPWIRAAGGNILPPAETGRPLELSRASIGIISFFAQLSREGLTAPGAFEKTGADRLEEFAQGKIAMLTVPSRDIPLLGKRLGTSLGVTSVPAAAAAGKNRLGLSSIYAGISAECTRPDEAWTFITFLAGQSPVLAAALEAVPGSLPGAFSGGGAFPAAYITGGALLSKAWEIFEAADIIESFSGSPREAELEQLLRDHLTAALADE